MNFQFVKNKKAVIIGSVFFIVLAAVILLVLRTEYSSEDNRIKILSENVDLQVRDVLYTDVGDSGMKWEIMADTAKYMKNENLAVFDNVRIKVVMPDGKTFAMTGKSGRRSSDHGYPEIFRFRKAILHRFSCCHGKSPDAGPGDGHDPFPQRSGCFSVVEGKSQDR
jgi:hypothetical protein